MMVEEFVLESTKTARIQGHGDEYPKLGNLLQMGGKGFFFSFLVRMVLELIELNYREGIWGLAIAKCRC